MLPEKLYGINTVFSLLKVNAGNRKIYEILISKSRENSNRISELILIAKNRKIPVRFLEAVEFSTLFASEQSINHIWEDISSTQGVVALTSQYNHLELEGDIKKISNSLIERKSSGKIIFVILAGITDVGNFGAILRNCSAFGVDGVIVPKNRSVSVNRRVSRISSGALEEIKVYSVVNLVETIKTLKKYSFWIYGTSLSEDSKILPAGSAEYIFPAALIFGNEQKGITKLIEKNCDVLVNIELYGSMQSLNVAVSTGIILYIVRQYEKING